MSGKSLRTPSTTQSSPPATSQGMEQGSNQQALASSGLQQPPAAQAPSIELYGFRGVRSVDGTSTRDLAPDDPRKQEVDKVITQNYLLFAGHIGVSVDGGSKIYGLTPQIPEGMDFATAKDLLHNHAAAFPGRVSDDKPVFDQADKYHREAGWNTKVISVKRKASPDEHAALASQLSEMAAVKPGEHGLFYSFPDMEAGPDGSWFGDKPSVEDASCTIGGDQQANCATFPGHLGIELPEQSGNLRDYMAAMESEASSGNGGSAVYGS